MIDHKRYGTGYCHVFRLRPGEESTPLCPGYDGLRPGWYYFNPEIRLLGGPYARKRGARYYAPGNAVPVWWRVCSLSVCLMAVYAYRWHGDAIFQWMTERLNSHWEPLWLNALLGVRLGPILADYPQAVFIVGYFLIWGSLKVTVEVELSGANDHPIQPPDERKAPGICAC
jgi:hypothetical protein